MRIYYLLYPFSRSRADHDVYITWTFHSLFLSLFYFILGTDRYNPSWGETKFLLINSLSEALSLTLFDWNEHRRDSELGAATFDLTKLGEDAVQEGIEAKILKDGKERGELRFDLSFYPVLKPQKIDGGKEEDLPDTSTFHFSE